MRWTDEDEAFLRENYEEMDTGELAEKLNRDRKSIYNKAQHLGLSDNYKFWSQSEEDYFKKHWEGLTLEELSQKLDRSKSALKQRAQEMDLPSQNCQGPTKTWTQEEENFLMANYPREKINDLAERLDRTHSSVAHKIKRLEITETWKLWEDEILRDFYGWPQEYARDLTKGFLSHRSEDSIKKRAERLGLSATSEKITKVCPTCGQEFDVLQVEAERRVHCSRGCQLRDKDSSTDIERMMEDELEEFGIEFKREEPVGRYTIDFLIGDIDLETDGDYWHRNGIDHDRDDYMRKNGYIPIHYWGSEVRENTEGCVTDLLTLLGGVHNF